MRFTSRWAIATMLPSAIVGTASAMTSGDHCGRRGPKPCTSTRTSFSGMAKLDDLAVFLMVIILAAALLTVFVSATTIPRWNMPLGEYYALLAFSALGGLLVASSTDLVMVFVGIELSSLSIFVLAAFARRSRESIEGALKYF